MTLQTMKQEYGPTGNPIYGGIEYFPTEDLDEISDEFNLPYLEQCECGNIDLMGDMKYDQEMLPVCGECQKP